MVRNASFQATRPLTRSQTRARTTTKSPTLCTKPSNTKRTPARRPPIKALITDLQTRLQQSASPTYAAWLTRYLRNVPCRGLKNPAIEQITRTWAGHHALLTTPHPHSRRIARAILESPWTEDKQAATIYLHALQKCSHFGERATDVEFMERLFDDGHLANWGTVDSFSLRVVASFVEDPARAVAVSAWVHAENLWRARASVVALIPFVRKGRVEEVMKGCEVLIRREERFAKTAVGWALREVHRVDPERVTQFVAAHAQELSMEAARNALKHVPSAERDNLLALVKVSRRG